MRISSKLWIFDESVPVQVSFNPMPSILQGRNEISGREARWWAMETEVGMIYSQVKRSQGSKAGLGTMRK